MANVYRIGVQIAMASNGPQVLGALGRSLTGIHTQTNQLTGGFNRLKLAIGGALAAAAGVAVIKMFDGPLEQARKMEMAVGRFSRFGLGPERTREAAEFAKAMNIAGSTYVENMNRMSEAQGVFRESGLSGSAALRGAKMAAPVLAKIDFANRGLDEDSRAKMNTQAMSMLRFIEMRGGVNSPEAFNSIANAGFKAITSSGGNINWEQLRQFMARGGVAAQGLSNEALFAKMEPVIGELKGSTAGFAFRTAFNRLNGIVRLPNQAAHELVDAGIWDGSKIKWNSQGGIKSFNGNPLRDANLFSSDPVAFYEKYLRPMYERRGLNTLERGRENALIFGSTGGAMFSLIDRQQHAIENSVSANRAAMGINQAYNAAGGTLNGRIVDLQARYVNLMERLGEAVLPLAVKGLEVLVPAIANLTSWVAKHPGAVKAFATAAVAIGAALVVVGGIAVAIAAGSAIMAGGAVGVVVAAVGAIVAVVDTVILLNWKALSGAVSAVWSFIVQLYKVAAFIIGHPFDAAAMILTPQKRQATAAQAAASNANPFSARMKPGDSYYEFGGLGSLWNAAGGRPSAVPPARTADKPWDGHVFLDGRKVTDIIAKRQARDLGGVRATAGRQDPKVSIPSANGVVTR